jgi:hypothetical protein
MMEQLARGMNVYYRGYVIHEDIRRIHYTVYGTGPHRTELASAGSSREAMRWVDQHIAENPVERFMGWPALFPTEQQPASSDSW